jgi:UDP:flavonoid glycosyltransferase YjiC (YdhE family)
VSRFLLVTLPLTGHINPAAGIGQELARRGHQVAWVGPQKVLRPAIGEDATILRTGLRLYRSQGDHGLTSVMSLWDRYLIPLARFTLAAVDKAVQEYRPDVIVADQHALAGALAARRRGGRWATLAPSAMELTRPYRDLPGVERWVGERLAELAAWAGESPDGLLWSPSLALACTTRALAGDAPLPGQARLVGPVLGGRPAGPGFAWEWLETGSRHVLVTVGTLAEDLATGFCERAVAALAPLAPRVRAIVVAPDGVLPGPPPGVLVTPRVPLLELMPRLDAVVCHGGMNTVCEALAHGVPLVVAPIRHDQPVAAAQVAAAGAGLRVPFARVRPGQLREAVTRVLAESSFAAAAARIRESFMSAGGERAAAEHLTRFAAGNGKYP